MRLQDITNQAQMLKHGYNRSFIHVTQTEYAVQIELSHQHKSETHTVKVDTFDTLDEFSEWFHATVRAFKSRLFLYDEIEKHILSSSWVSVFKPSEGFTLFLSCGHRKAVFEIVAKGSTPTPKKVMGMDVIHLSSSDPYHDWVTKAVDEYLKSKKGAAHA